MSYPLPPCHRIFSEIKFSGKNTILVATDYSRAATYALHFAAALARDVGTKLVLYNAFQLPTEVNNPRLSATGLCALLDENKARLKLIAAENSKTYGVLTERISNISYVAEELGILGEKLKADLVGLKFKFQVTKQKELTR